MMLIDNPHGLPLQALDLRPTRTTSSTLPTAPQRLYDMGIISQQPSQDAEAEEELFDFTRAPAPHVSQSDVSMQDQCRSPVATAPTPTTTSDPAAKPQQQPMLISLRSTSNEQSLAVSLEPASTRRRTLHTF